MEDKKEKQPTATIEIKEITMEELYYALLFITNLN